METIPVVVDKSHLLTIGTRLYTESLDLIRELVANAYDADATEVRISFLENMIVVEDNGSGMDEEGLKQYFTIGSPFKKENIISPMYKRLRIGEFGIGKFSALTACERFEVTTVKNSFSATVIFDSSSWSQGEKWELPIVRHATNGKKANGTRVVLTSLKKKFPLDQLERRLKEKIPLAVPDFKVYLEGVLLKPTYIPGKRFRIREITPFGKIIGCVILSNLPLAREYTGIEIKVKKMFIKKEFFSLDRLHKVAINRIAGEINADFLPVTSGRNEFIKDSPEYLAFEEILEKRLKKIALEIKKLGSKREEVRASSILSEAMLKVRQALRKNPDFLPTGLLPLFAKKGLSGTFGPVKKKNRKKGKVRSGKLEANNRKKKEVEGRVRTVLTSGVRIVKSLKIGGLNVTVSLARLGEEEVESFTQGGVIVINRDHPLYKRVEKSAEMQILYLARLITQELSLLANPSSAEQAYLWQSRLLTDAFVEKGK